MKYAVIEHGGKQYLAKEGESFEVDLMQLESGKPVVFKEVLLLVDGSNVRIGKPHVSGVSVKGTVEEHVKGRKILVFKYKPKQRYRRRRGHRQQYTRVVIDSITSRTAKKKTEAAGTTDKPGAEAKGQASEAKKSSASAAAKKRTTVKGSAKSSTTKTARSTSESQTQKKESSSTKASESKKVDE